MSLIGEADIKGTAREIIKALISDYVMVYYIDVTNNSYMEFMSDPDTQELTATMRGGDFFEQCVADCVEQVYYKDLDKVLAALNEKNLKSLISEAVFMLTYRLVVGGKPVWHTLKALYTDDRSHVLIAVRNINLQKTREAEYEKKLAEMSTRINHDALTRVNNQWAFEQEEARWDKAIAAHGGDVAFAVVMCDINDLKHYNDTLGHREGDALIVAAARLISNVFKRSPVFRIGGDEFAAVLSESDYDNREALLEHLREKIQHNLSSGEVVVAAGMAAYEKGKGERFSDVFRKADAMMYQDKKT